MLGGELLSGVLEVRRGGQVMTSQMIERGAAPRRQRVPWSGLCRADPATFELIAESMYSDQSVLQTAQPPPGPPGIFHRTGRFVLWTFTETVRALDLCFGLIREDTIPVPRRRADEDQAGAAGLAEALPNSCPPLRRSPSSVTCAPAFSQHFWRPRSSSSRCPSGHRACSRNRGPAGELAIEVAASAARRSSPSRPAPTGWSFTGERDENRTGLLRKRGRGRPRSPAGHRLQESVSVLPDNGRIEVSLNGRSLGDIRIASPFDGDRPSDRGAGGPFVAVATACA